MRPAEPRCGGGRILSDFAGALVVPERPAAEQQQQREDRELGGADALLASVAVVPGEDQRRRAGRSECEERDLPELFGPVEGLADVFEALQEPPGGRDVHKSPLDDLAAAQSSPGALGSTLCRRVGQSSAPMASECSGLPAGTRGKHVHSDLKAATHAVSQRTRHG